MGHVLEGKKEECRSTILLLRASGAGEGGSVPKLRRDRGSLIKGHDARETDRAQPLATVERSGNGVPVTLIPFPLQGGKGAHAAAG